MSLYRIDRLSIFAGDTMVVDGVSLSVGPGEAVALAGESGSGKSLSCFTPFGLSGLRAEGSATLAGRELIGSDERELRRVRAHEVGFVFQQPLTALTPHRTVGQHLIEAARQAGRDRPGRDALRDMLVRVGLDWDTDWLKRFPHQLSGGQRQRLALAMALAHGPKLLVADEPTSALDAALRAEMMALIDRLRREEGIGLLIASHDLAGIEHHVDRICILRRGQLVEAGPAKTLIAAPRTDYARALVDATPRADSEILVSDLAESTADATPLLRASGVTTRFAQPGWRTPPLTAVDDVGLSLISGETLALVGGSGSGKSTLGRAIAGLGPMQCGEVLWNGAPLSKRRSREDRARMQPVFQDPFASLDPKWPLARSIAEPLVHLSPDMSRAEREERALSLMAEVGLSTDMAGRLPAKISGGQAQRVAIARALAPDPDMLLLDEATSALDPLVARSICELLLRLQKERGLAMLMITHDIALARQMAHRIAVMDAGRIVETGDARAILSSPTADATKRLTAATL